MIARADDVNLVPQSDKEPNAGCQASIDWNEGETARWPDAREPSRFAAKPWCGPGARSDRAKLALLLRRVEAGDTILVTRLDRLARSTRDLLNILHQLAERKVGFRSPGDTWADTTSPHGRLMLTMLGGLAEFERELIRSRTGDGRKRAMAKGVKFGRPRKLDPHQRHEALERIGCGETYVAIARTYYGRSQHHQPPVRLGFLASLARPGSNLTGVNFFVGSWRRSGWSSCVSWCPEQLVWPCLSIRPTLRLQSPL